MEIARGIQLDATTATGDIVRLRALDHPVRGRDIPVVWVCTEDEYWRAERDGDEADGLPWPLDAVEVVEAEAGVGH
jgi:hypothetical protein